MSKEGKVIWAERTVQESSGRGIHARRMAKSLREGLEQSMNDSRASTQKGYAEVVKEFLARLFPEPEVTVEFEDHPEDKTKLVGRIRVKNAPPEWVEAMRAAGVLVDGCP